MSLQLMKTETAVISRRAVGYYVNGFYVEGALSTISINASFQPMPGSEIIQLPEADRKKQLLWVFSETKINLGDIISRDIDEEQYEVLKVENWPTQGIVYYLATGALVDAQ